MDGVRRFLEWGQTQCLPLWMARSWDGETGGFVEALDFGGGQIAAMSRRFRVQARQVFVLASVADAGWFDTSNRLTEVMSWLERTAWRADGQDGWVHRLTPDGGVESPVRDLYDHAFALLALAWTYRVTRDARWKSLADETLHFLDSDMASEQGGFQEAIGAVCLPRRQNPHMHLFEALIALYDATGEGAYLDRVRKIYALFDGVFFDPEAGVVNEFFGADWGVLPDGQSALCEPGHACEWVWLLAQYDRVTGSDTSAQAAGLYETAMRLGASAKTGLLCSVQRADGATVDAGSRTWVQTEWLRASLVMRQRGHVSAADHVEQCIDRMFAHHFTGSIAGGWSDRVDAEGANISEYMPTSTLYHVVGALLESEHTLERC